MTSTAPRRRGTHKERLLTSGVRLFYARGYQGTTVDAILADAEVPKGSFYHHFGSKEAFGAAVLERYVVAQELLLRRWMTRDDLPVPVRLARYHQELVDRFIASDWRQPCLAGKLSNELAFSSEVFRRKLNQMFDDWAQQLATLLADGQRRHEVRTDMASHQLANAVLAMVQGAFVAALSLHDRDYLDAVTDSITDLVKVRP